MIFGILSPPRCIKNIESFLLFLRLYGDSNNQFVITDYYTTLTIIRLLYDEVDNIPDLRRDNPIVVT
jgi:hypothetical protein